MNWLANRAPRPAIHAASAMLFLALGFECHHSYFNVWAKDPNVPITFGAASAGLAGPAIGVPPPAQTVMFLMQSYTARQSEEANIHYIIRQAGDAEDGIDFCRKVALTVEENVLCLQVNSKPPPKF